MTEFIRDAWTAERMTVTPAARNSAPDAAVKLVSVVQHELRPRSGVL